MWRRSPSSQGHPTPVNDKLDSSFMVSVAAVDNELHLSTHETLYRVEDLND